LSFKNELWAFYSPYHSTKVLKRHKSFGRWGLYDYGGEILADRTLLVSNLGTARRFPNPKWRKHGYALIDGF
jgi:hypothetical protein